MRATDPAQMRRELGWRFAARCPRSCGRCSTTSARGIETLVDQMAGYWERALAPWWDQVRALLEADIRHRAGRLAGGGALELFAGLHAGVRWRSGSLEVEATADVEVELAGRGLQLVPSVFVWPRTGAMFDPPWQPSVIYPPRGVGDLWTPSGEGPAALGDLRRPRARADPHRARRGGVDHRARAAPGGEPGRGLRAPRRPAPRRARARPPRGPLGALLAHRRRRRAHSPSVFPRISFMISSVPPPIGPSRASRAARARSSAAGWPRSASMP